MKLRPVDPTRLDVQAFAKDGGSLDGEWPATLLERLYDATHSEARPTDADLVQWSAQGESRPRRASVPEVWLHVQAKACVSLVCQRCLGPVNTLLNAQRSFHFVANEDLAAQLDADTDDDVLAMTRSLNMYEL